MKSLLLFTSALLCAFTTLQVKQAKSENRSFLINYDSYAPPGGGITAGSGAHGFPAIGFGSNFGGDGAYGGGSNYLGSGGYGSGVGGYSNGGGGGGTYHNFNPQAFESGFAPIFPQIAAPIGYRKPSFNELGSGFDSGGYAGIFGVPSHSGYSFSNAHGGFFGSGGSVGNGLSGPISSHRPRIAGLHTNIGAAFGGGYNSIPYSAYGSNAVGGHIGFGGPIGGYSRIYGDYDLRPYKI